METVFGFTCEAKHIPNQICEENFPSTSLTNFSLPPWAFDFSEGAKYGNTGRYPSNHQYRAHFASFVHNGFESHREAIDVKFRLSEEDRNEYKIHPFHVGFVDGQNKALIVQSIIAMLAALV